MLLHDGVIELIELILALSNLIVEIIYLSVNPVHAMIIDIFSTTVICVI